MGIKLPSEMMLDEWLANQGKNIYKSSILKTFAIP